MDSQAWKLPANVVETATTHLHEVLEYLAQAGLDGTLRASYDGDSLRVEVLFVDSTILHLPPAREPHAPTYDERVDALDNEEAALMVGLRSFLRSLSTDRMLLRVRHGRALVRLGYAA